MENFLGKVEKVTAISLLALMAIIVLSATAEVGYIVATNIFKPPGFFIGVEDLFKIFGLFLMVLIGLELMTSIRDYLEDSNIHGELMLLVALTAVTRKVVILDAKETDALTIFGIGFLIIALAGGYYLVRRSGNFKTDAGPK